MLVENAGYLPGLNANDIDRQAQLYGPEGNKITVLLPVLEDKQATKLVTHVREQACLRLKSRPLGQILDIIDITISRLLDRQDPYRRRMEELLPIVTGYDREMVRLGLTSYLKTFRKPQLQRFLSEDFMNPAILDSFQPLPKGGLGRAFGPKILTHVWSGNVPGIPLWSLVAGLLVKAGNIGKIPTVEPIFASLFSQLFAEVAPELADCLAIVWWKGGSEAIETTVFNESDMVLGYGQNESLAAIQNLIPITKRFLAYGNKFSLAMVSAEALNVSKVCTTARLLAYDVARYDQQGCYAPQMVFVEREGSVSPERFAQYLAHELAVFEEKFPLRPLSLAEANKIICWRNNEEMTPGGKVFFAETGSWAVSYQADGKFSSPSCLNRTIRVVGIDDLMQAPNFLAPYSAHLQTVGVAASPEALVTLASALGEVGVTRIAAIGDMTSPEAGWHHDGRFNLLDLVKITEIDGRAEDAAEQFAYYDV
ncbi:MAG: acyl-CoA reductase [Magnetovibrio sp.]|nr:acyl-CoA reductase [Magnetovibrio sp.]